MANPNPIVPVEHQFKVGNPGGPGRPRKRPLSEAYDDWLREPIAKEKLAKLRAEGVSVKAGATNADLVALAQGNQAVRGNTTAAKEMREAVEGKATQRIELSRGEDAATPDQLVVVYATAVPGDRELPAPAANNAASNPVIDVTPEEAKAVLDVIAKEEE